MKKSLFISALLALIFAGCGASTNTTTQGASLTGMNGVMSDGNCSEQLVEAHNNLVFDANAVKTDTGFASTSAVSQDVSKLTADCGNFMQAYPNAVCNALNLTDGTTVVIRSSDIQTACTAVEESGTVLPFPGTGVGATVNYSLTVSNSNPNLNPACDNLNLTFSSWSTLMSMSPADPSCDADWAATINGDTVSISDLILSSADRSLHCDYAGTLTTTDQITFSGIVYPRTLADGTTNPKCTDVVLTMVKK